MTALTNKSVKFLITLSHLIVFDKMDTLQNQVKEIGVLRRLIFATRNLPAEIPHYWQKVASFGSKGSKNESLVSADLARTMENLEYIDASSFATDDHLMKELIDFRYGDEQHPMGIPLLPNEKVCLLCDSQLQLRGDRPSNITLYTETFGTVPGMHYHKYCKSYRKGCKFVQFYGFYKKEGDGLMFYNANWNSLQYFVSSQETGFELRMLQKFDAELLIGQISFKQKADIYNLFRGYDSTNKKTSAKPLGQHLNQPVAFDR